MKLKFNIKGTSPLCMHSLRGANPLSEESKAMKQISSKRKKTDDDHHALSDLEWDACLYLNEDGQLIVPGVNILSCLRDGGKELRLGKTILEACVVPGDPLLGYKGPKTIAALKKDRNFRLVTMQRVGTARVMRTWAKFDSWWLEFFVMFPDDIVGKDAIADSMHYSGRMKGLLEGRQRGRGRFEVVSIEVVD